MRQGHAVVDVFLHRIHDLGLVLVEEVVGSFHLLVGDLDTLLGGQAINQFLDTLFADRD